MQAAWRTRTWCWPETSIASPSRKATSPVADPVRTVELRVLDGPNLYFPRPAVKLTLDVAGWLRAGDEKVAEIARATGIRSIDPGARGRAPRLRATARGAGQPRRRTG